MRSATAAAIVAVKVLVKQEVVLEVGIRLKLFVAAEDGAPPVRTAPEQLEQAAAKLVGDLLERQHDAGAGWAFDGEPIAVELMEAAQILDQQIVDLHPDRSAPVRVAAEQSAVGFPRLVLHAIMHAVVFEIVGVIEIGAGEGAHAVGREKFAFVQHAPQQLRHAESPREREQTSSLRANLVPARNELGQIRSALPIHLDLAP